MKRFAVLTLSLTAMLFLLNACASHDEVVTQQPNGAVAGEKVSGETAVEPGVGGSGASANVRF
jgi:hypothetical protein